MYPKVYEFHITWHYKLDTLFLKLTCFFCKNTKSNEKHPPFVTF